MTDTAISSIKKEIEVLLEYRSRIISDVITGKIDVRNIEIPNYEKAEEALDDNLAVSEELGLSEVD